MTNQTQKIPKGWKETTLGENLSDKGYIRGPFGSALKRGEMKKFGIPVYEQQNAIYNHREFRYFIDQDKYNELKRFTIKPKDIVISCSGTLGKTTIIKENDPIGIISQALLILRVDNKKLDSTYLNYFLNSKEGRSKLLGASHGSVQVNIAKRSEVENISLLLPLIKEQHAIAAVLSSLDDKIELLREQNKTLEATAQAIFKEWFVKFNFPGATGKMIDSELGKIPEGWKVGRLEDEFDITIGRTPPRLETQWFSKNSNEKKWISIKDIVNSEVYISNTSEYLTSEAIEKFNIPVIPENTAVLSFKMTVGKLAITTEEMLSNEAIAHLKINNNSHLSTEYIYLFLKGLDFNSLGSTSSIVTAINSTMIKMLHVLIPEAKTMKSFNALIQPIFAKLKNNSSQIQTLSDLRDTLLPKLMKGEVRVTL